MEYVSLEGLRLDGRRPKETRRMRCELTALPGSNGSAVFELGNTKVLAAVQQNGLALEFASEELRSSYAAAYHIMSCHLTSCYIARHQ